MSDYASLTPSIARAAIRSEQLPKPSPASDGGGPNGPEPMMVAVIDLDLDRVSYRPSELKHSEAQQIFVLVRNNQLPVALDVLAPQEGVSTGAILELARHRFGGLTAQERIRPSAHSLEAATIVVPSRDRPARLQQSLLAILPSLPPSWELLVVDNAPSNASTRELVEAMRLTQPNLSYACEPVPGLARARNRGLAEARTPFIVYFDDDVEPEPECALWLTSALQESKQVWCSVGLLLPAELETPAQVLFEQFGGFEAGVDRCSFARDQYPPPSKLFPYSPGLFGTGGCSAFRTFQLRALGGFDQRLGIGTPARGGEDIDVMMRVIRRGGTLIYEPAAIAWHAHHRSYDRLLRQLEGYGAGLSAVYTKLVCGPATTIDILRRIPDGLRHLLSPASTKNQRRAPGYPSALIQAELYGLACGPARFFLSVLNDIRLTRTSLAQSTCDSGKT